MSFLSAIEAKRDGEELSPEALEFAVTEFTAGRIPDYQMSAFLMAVYFKGMTVKERRALTLAMRDSGDTLNFPEDSRPLVDKHSTGGVGDKVSLPLAPLLATLGFRVPMISGRGLGITGGTLDKLESIPGFQTLLEPERIVEMVQEVGCVIVGQTDRMIPADKRMYALRDVTGTVPSIPLITASILSKKLAGNLDALILDAKFGSAAFMPTIGGARELARSIVDLGNEFGVKTCAMLTDMDMPLGRAAGNWLEVRESVEVLEGGGSEDLRALVVECAARLLNQVGVETSLNDARAKAAAHLHDGSALVKWNEMLVAQGVDLERYEQKLHRGEVPGVARDRLLAAKSGIVARCNARVVGEVVRDLGGGRLNKESRIDHEVGIEGLAKPGDEVNEGEVIARVFAASESEAADAVARLAAAIEIVNEPVEAPALIREIVE